MVRDGDEKVSLKTLARAVLDETGRETTRETRGAAGLR